jgi:hypothetical protein
VEIVIVRDTLRPRYLRILSKHMRTPRSGQVAKTFQRVSANFTEHSNSLHYRLWRDSCGAIPIIQVLVAKAEELEQPREQHNCSDAVEDQKDNTECDVSVFKRRRWNEYHDRKYAENDKRSSSHKHCNGFECRDEDFVDCIGHNAMYSIAILYSDIRVFIRVF